MSSLLKQWIRLNARGKSFLEVGGLTPWDQNMVTTAAQAGANKIAMLDRLGADDARWSEFRDAMYTERVPEVECQSADVQYLGTIEQTKRYDIVYCGNLFYQVRDPLALLSGLRKAAKDVVIVTSTVVQPFEKLVSSGETVRFRNGDYRCAALCSDDENAAFDAALRERGIALPQFIDAPPPNEAGLRETIGMWWWFFSEAAVRDMLTSNGLVVEECIETWNDRAYAYVCRKV